MTFALRGEGEVEFYSANPNEGVTNVKKYCGRLSHQKPKFPKQRYNARSTIDNRNREYEEIKTKGISQDDIAKREPDNRSRRRRRKPNSSAEKKRAEEDESRRRRESAERRLQKGGSDRARKKEDGLWQEDLTDGRKSGAK